ncbi:hypothetical protein TRFO_03705 [Tritrichomonas foetus]|uniref:BTB domain-containing protein n=1 Tax=Tritrichomonas foetus TaxID=1144522 RepID=A0A1J4KLA9_9EUKA|nr:hypothetical protein TRFO_03705 [Tritrichomonas foetus]|eukprot:OHT12087.1 hypothetical protein TRFO_03705 [Tritrichomonas foetus]
MKALTISNRGLSNLQSYLQDDNTFLFKIGERKLKVHQILAAFISPKVAHMHTIDPTLESFEINLTSKSIFYQQYKTYALTTGKDKVEEKIINIITSITEGIPLNAVPDDHDLYHFLSKVLDNPEIYTAFTTIFPFEININNCLSTLYQIISTSSNFNAENDEFENPEFQRVVNFIASNFGTLLEKKVSRFSLFDIPLNILIIILRKENLNIKNVDSFASFILDLSLKGLLTKENEVDFLELIDFSHISGPIFTKVMDQLDPKNFNSFIWQKLLACFPKYEGSQILNNPKKRSNSNNNISQTPSNKAEGIIKN